MTHSLNAWWRPTVFAAGYGLLVLFEVFITRSGAFQRQPAMVAGAVLFDLVVPPAIVFYWLVIRPTTRSWLSLAVAVVTFLRVALFVLPAGAAPFTISWSALAAGLEAGVFLVAIWRGRALQQTYRALRRTHDRETSFYGSIEAVLGRRLAVVLGTEAQVLRFSLLGWWRLPNAGPPVHRALTAHRESGQTALVLSLLAVGIIEGAVTHLLLHRWNPTVAFWVTLISAYGLLFLLADLVATRSRPSFLVPATFHLRLGIRWRAEIARSNIARATPLHDKPAKEPGLLNGVLLTAPNLLLALHEPVWVAGPYGMQRRVHKLALFVDDTSAFNWVSSSAASGR